MKNLAKLNAMWTELAQRRKELADEWNKITHLEKELEELKLDHHVNNEHRFRAKDKQQRAEKEMKDMEEWLEKAVEDGTWAEVELTGEKERVDNLLKKQRTLQEKRRVSEKI